MCHAVCALLICSALPGFAEPASPADTQPRELSDLQLGLDELSNWGVRSYRMTCRDSTGRISSRGVLRLVTLVKDDEIILRDTREFSIDRKLFEDKSIWRVWKRELVQRCRKTSYLSPTRLMCEEVADGKRRSQLEVTIDMDRGSFERHFFDRDATSHGRIIVRPETLTLGSALRVVSMLPQVKGQTVFYDAWLNDTVTAMSRDGAIRCLGMETVKAQGRLQELTRFEAGRFLNVWVRSDGIPVRITESKTVIYELQDPNAASDAQR